MDKNVVHYMDCCANGSHTEVDPGKVCRECTPPLLYDDMQHSNTTGILKRENLWFIGVEVK